MLEISIRQLEAFVATVEFCSFTRAAEELHLTQSTISLHIRALEELLQARLIERGAHRKVALTEEGKQVYFSAQEILEKARLLQERKGEGEQKLLKIGTSTVPAQYLLPKLLSAFTVKHPEARYLLRRGDSDHILSCLNSGEIRLALIGHRSEDKTLSYAQIAEDHLVLITPNNEHFRSLQAEGKKANDLLNYPLIARLESSGTQHAAQKFLQQLKAEPPIIARMDNPETIRMSVSEGIGCAIVSDLSVSSEIQAGKLLSFPFVGIDDSRKLFLAWPKGTVLSPIESKFIQFVKSKTGDILSLK